MDHRTMYRAVVEGNAQAVRALLDANPESGHLHYAIRGAVREGRPKCLQELLEHGSYTTLVIVRYAVDMAALGRMPEEYRQDVLECLRLLLQPSSLTKSEERITTPIEWQPVRSVSHAYGEAIAETGGSPECPVYAYLTSERFVDNPGPFVGAAEYGDCEVLRRLAEHLRDPERGREYAKAALANNMSLGMGPNPEVVEFLVERYGPEIIDPTFIRDVRGCRRALRVRHYLIGRMARFLVDAIEEMEDHVDRPLLPSCDVMRKILEEVYGTFPAGVVEGAYGA